MVTEWYGYCGNQMCLPIFADLSSVVCYLCYFLWTADCSSVMLQCPGDWSKSKDQTCPKTYKLYTVPHRRTYRRTYKTRTIISWTAYLQYGHPEMGILWFMAFWLQADILIVTTFSTLKCHRNDTLNIVFVISTFFVIELRVSTFFGRFQKTKPSYQGWTQCVIKQTMTTLFELVAAWVPNTFIVRWSLCEHISTYT